METERPRPKPPADGKTPASEAMFNARPGSRSPPRAPAAAVHRTAPPVAEQSTRWWGHRAAMTGQSSAPSLRVARELQHHHRRDQAQGAGIAGECRARLELRGISPSAAPHLVELNIGHSIISRAYHYGPRRRCPRHTLHLISPAPKRNSFPRIARRPKRFPPSGTTFWRTHSAALAGAGRTDNDRLRLGKPAPVATNRQN